MRTEPRESGRNQWVPLAGDQHKVIARKTLSALTALLADSPTAVRAGHRASPEPDGTLVLRLTDLPELAKLGGIARVEPARWAPVAIARIGRSTFAAYQTRDAADGIREVSVWYDEQAGTLRLRTQD